MPLRKTRFYDDFMPVEHQNTGLLGIEWWLLGLATYWKGERLDQDMRIDWGDRAPGSHQQ